MEPQPPRRTTHAIGGPARMLVYDRWGHFGRPVVLLHGLLFDRSMWWPVAAELASPTTCTTRTPDRPGPGNSPATSTPPTTCTTAAPDRPGHGDSPAKPVPATACTVIAPDLPGHGDSPARQDHDLGQLAHDLAQLVLKLNLHRAPIVVGHAESAALAAAFAERFAVHEVLTVDDLGGARTEIPEHYQPYATPKSDIALLTTYRTWPPHPPTWPHLADPRGFAAGLQARLATKR